MPAPRALYRHGFASGPDSKKGVWLDQHFAPRGLPLQRLDLRRPSFERLRFSAMLAHVREVIGDDPGPVLLLGSSLGGLTAARIAEAESRVVATVLLAPAFGLAARWRAKAPETLAAWQASGWLETRDHTTGQLARVHWDFLPDLEALDPGLPALRVPTLIVHGVHDDTVPVEHSRAFVAVTPCARLVEVEDGHELVESLQRIAAEMEAHLAPWLR